MRIADIQTLAEQKKWLGDCLSQALDTQTSRSFIIDNAGWADITPSRQGDTPARVPLFCLLGIDADSARSDAVEMCSIEFAGQVITASYMLKNDGHKLSIEITPRSSERVCGNLLAPLKTPPQLIKSWRLALPAFAMTWSAGMDSLLRLTSGTEPSWALFAGVIGPAAKAEIEDWLAAPGDELPLSITARILAGDGAHRWVEIVAQKVVGAEGGGEVRGTVKDITAQQHAQLALRDYAALMDLTVSHAGIGTWSVDVEKGRITRSKLYLGILGYTNEEMGNQTIEPLIHPGDAADYETSMRDLLMGRSIPKMTFRVKSKQGPYKYLSFQARAIQDPTSLLVTRIIGTVADVSRQIMAEDRMHYLSNFDSLTGIANLHHFTTQLQKAIDSAAASQQRLNVLLLDIDRFKDINDAGMEIGERVLKEVASRLTLAVEESGACVARRGGDEFLAYFLGEESVFQQTVTHIQSALSAPFESAGYKVRITASMGVAVYRQDGTTVSELIHYAEMAMYAAKDAGRNNIQYFMAYMASSASQKSRLERGLRRAIPNKEFELWYQPQCDLEGRIAGLEALIRWRRDEKIVANPDEFIPIAESCGLIDEIGMWVVETAMTQAKQWETQFNDPPPVAINLSAFQFKQGGFARRIIEAANRIGIRPSKIELEMTETALFHEESRIVDQIDLLRKAGFTIAIDDFGTGYSSMLALQALPIDRLKIDRRFVMKMHNDPASSSIVKFVLDMSKALGLSVVAEGVESPLHVENLRKLGCDVFQGYWFSRPVQASVIDTFLKTGRVDTMRSP